MSGFSSFTFGVPNYFSFTFSFQLGRPSHDPMVFVPQDLKKTTAEKPGKVSVDRRAFCSLLNSNSTLYSASSIPILPCEYPLTALTMNHGPDTYQPYCGYLRRAGLSRRYIFPSAGSHQGRKKASAFKALFCITEALHGGSYHDCQRTHVSAVPCCITKTLPITLRYTARD